MRKFGKRARSGLNGVSAHEQCIDVQRAEVPVGHCANLAAPIWRLNAAWKSLQDKNVGFECHAARGIPRYGITPRGDRQ
jgi:hypothetical protein